MTGCKWRNKLHIFTQHSKHNVSCWNIPAWTKRRFVKSQNREVWVLMLCWGPQTSRVWSEAMGTRYVRLDVNVNEKDWMSPEKQSDNICDLYIAWNGFFSNKVPPEKRHKQKDTFTQSPFTSSFLRGFLFQMTYFILSHARSNSHRCRGACAFTHTHFQNNYTLKRIGPLCEFCYSTLLCHFYQTLFGNLCSGKTKSVISLVVLMHQTFLISGIEKRAAER